ncbi:lipase family protein [Pannus brasiliensis CCIBt3594]|uniref:Lipase family protein n=1 Tax=Pannus brasiliensis CCIBt3594 TaxID=1427578 RepID=A0AAW9QPA5_9CHRO
MNTFGKVQISQNSGFDVRKAIELANLVSIAYNEYEVWDKIGSLQERGNPPRRVPVPPLPDTIIGSSAFIRLESDNREKFAVNQDNPDYQKLNQYWQQKPERIEEYDRLYDFWFPQWWWADLLNSNSLRNLLNTDITDILQNLGRLVSRDQIFGFIARSKTNPDRFFIVLRGTREGAEWFNNFRPVPKVFLDEANLGEVRNGFNLIYTRNREGIDLDRILGIARPFSIKETIQKFAKEHLTDRSEILITGHSLGAALATLAACHLHAIAVAENLTPSIDLYTIASPRVGDETFAEIFKNPRVPLRSYRVFNSEDLVPSVPFPTTSILDEESLRGMSPSSRARFLGLRAFLETLTGGQSDKKYEHIGIPIAFTTQTGTIAGNHNLTKTYREALNLEE